MASTDPGIQDCSPRLKSSQESDFTWGALGFPAVRQPRAAGDWGNSLPAVPLPADVNKNPAALLPEAHWLLASPYVLNPNPGFPFQILCPGLGPHPASGPGSVFTQLSLLRFSRPNFLFRFRSPGKQTVGCLLPLSRGAYN